MKEQNEIDQLFEEQLGNLSVEPNADSWEKITSSLDATTGASSNGRKKVILFALLGTVAALLAYILFFNQAEKPTSSIKVHPIVKVQDDENDIKTNKTLEKEMNLKSGNVIVNEQSSSSKSSINSKSKISKISKKKSEVVQSAKPSQRMTKQVITTSKLKTKKNKPSYESKTPLIVATSGLHSEKANSNSSKKVVSQKNEANLQTEITVIEAEESVSSEKVTRFVEEEVSEVDSSLLISDNIEITAVDESSSVPSPSSTAGIYRATAWSIDAYFGPAFIRSNEQALTEQEEGDVFYSAEKEQRIITPNLGLNVKYHINNWFIQSGIAYAEYGENRNYLQTTTLHDTIGYSKQVIDRYYTYDTTGWIQDPKNSSVLIPVFDAIEHIDTNYRWVHRDSLYYEHQNVYAQNRYRYIEIPAMVGYEFQFKNLGVQVATGVSVGFRVNSSGKFLDSQNNLIDINSSNSQYSNTMMNYILSVGVKYNLNKNLSIIAQPIYKTNLNSLIKSGIGTDTRYHSFGVNVGINYIIK